MKTKEPITARFTVLSVREPTRPALRGKAVWDEDGNPTVSLEGDWADDVAEDIALGLTGLSRKEQKAARHSIGTALGPVHLHVEQR